MAIEINVQDITGARHECFDGGEWHGAFDVVRVSCRPGGAVTLFFPCGAGQAVADAINEAVKPALVEAAE